MNSIPKLRNQVLLRQAFTHSSYVNEHPMAGEDNERLEFFGDSILKFMLSDYLYHNHPFFKEGVMTIWRSDLEKNQKLSVIARQIGVGERLLLGRGMELQGGRNSVKILSGALEALIAACYLDLGLEPTKQYVRGLFSDYISTVSA